VTTGGGDLLCGGLFIGELKHLKDTIEFRLVGNTGWRVGDG